METGKRKIEEAYRELEARIGKVRRLVDDDEKSGRISEEAVENVENLVALMGFLVELACDSANAWERRARKWKRRAKRSEAMREFESVKT